MDENLEAEKIATQNAPATVGPYSQAVKYGNLVFCSGQIGIDPKTNELVTGGTVKQLKQVINNLQQVLIGSGSNLSKVVQTTIYISDITEYPQINSTYAEYFKTEPLPARATVEVAALPKGASIEISCIAYI